MISPTTQPMSAARWAELRTDLAELAQLYIREHVDGDVVIARAPGRVNLMGRHVDHQGGHVNMMAIDRAIHVGAGLRSDRLVRMVNVNSGVFGGREFSLDELLPVKGAWREVLDSPQVQERAISARGDWSQYARAALARIQASQADRRLPGLNLAIAGNVPRAAGLSSSSALLIAIMEAALALYGISMAAEEFAEFAGEAEWYVGTRGGAGDHAALKLAEPGSVVQIGFFPLEKTASAPFPAGCTLLICDSGVKAAKSAGAKDIFNQRVACYHIGRELIKQNSSFGARITHLRDLNVEHLGTSTPQILRLVAGLPFRTSRPELREVLPASFLDSLFASHEDPVGGYPVREIVLFGLSECERSRGFAALLGAGDLNEIGREMNISHDGDRMALQAEPFVLDYSDAAVSELVMSANQTGFRLADIPGRYSCSPPAIDQMVDIALSVDGVLGAQIVGAGLGGCMMALVRKAAVEPLKAALTSRYYEPSRQEPVMLECAPSTGSGLVSPDG